MHGRRPSCSLHDLLNSYYSTSFCQNAFKRRYTQKAPRHLVDPPEDRRTYNKIAIIGGGIAGLSCANSLARQLPRSSITLFEGSERLGGWIQSEYIDVKDGKVLFEGGPRTLRPHGLSARLTLNLAKEVGLEGDVVTTPKTASAAQNRFIYYGDRLVRLPGPSDSLWKIMWALMTNPLLSGVLKALLTEAVSFDPASRSKRLLLKDESVGDFLCNRFSKGIADNVASAFFHGIYAGDIYQLSARRVLANFWHREKRFGSLTASYLYGWSTGKSMQSLMDCRYEKLSRITESMQRQDIKAASLWGFRRGMEQLPIKIEENLRTFPNVTIHKNSPVANIVSTNHRQKVTIHARSDSPSPFVGEFDLAICMVPLQTLPIIFTTPGNNSSLLSNQLLEESLSNELSDSPMATVAVVNMYFPPSATKILQHSGFGYLIPRTLSVHKNPEHALGVLFASEGLPDQDIGAAATGTKVTVMLGGHMWADLVKKGAVPSEAQCKADARTVLRRQLGITAEPEIMRVSVQHNCIPQPPVGQAAQLARLHHEIRRVYGNCVRVGGSGVHGISVGDCVKSGIALADTARMGLEWIERNHPTGLEQFTEENDNWHMYSMDKMLQGMQDT